MGCFLNTPFYLVVCYVQMTVDTASEEGRAKVSELEQHTTHMAQVIQQMESRFDTSLLTYLTKQLLFFIACLVLITGKPLMTNDACRIMDRFVMLCRTSEML